MVLSTAFAFLLVPGFSGNVQQVVSFTIRAFTVTQNTCNANLLHRETGRIVQLHYRHKLLLISTSERSVLLTHDGRTIQIGTKASRKYSARKLFAVCDSVVL